jgi:hypothetical protein
MSMSVLNTSSVLGRPPPRVTGPLDDQQSVDAKRPHFRRLAVRSPVSRQKSRRLLIERLDSGGVSLLAKFSISEFARVSVQRPVAFPRRPVRILPSPIGGFARRRRGAAASLPLADAPTSGREVAFGPTADSCTAANAVHGSTPSCAPLDTAAIAARACPRRW